MELGIYILFVLMVVSVLLLNLVVNGKNKNSEKRYIKSEDFLLMENDGEDPCRFEQTIEINHYYAEPLRWTIEVK